MGVMWRIEGTNNIPPGWRQGGDKQVSKKPEHVFLIDGSGFIFRAYYAIKAEMTRPDGTPVNAVFGFTKMLMKLLADTDADHVAVIFDHARKTFRNDIYAEYKANRPPPPDDLIPQFGLVRDATRALNVAAVDMKGYEADDLIATYARLAVEAGADVTIVSSDKELMQLVRPGVVMMDAMKEKMIGPDEVMEKFGVGPDKVIEVQALAGDSSDNVPGVSGIGVKTAAQLINEYGDLETLLSRAHEIKQPKRRQNLIDEADAARISKELVTLRDDVPVELDLASFAVREPEPEALLAFLKAQDFKSLVKSVAARLGAEAGETQSEVEIEAERKSQSAETQPRGKGEQEAPAGPVPGPAAGAVYELVQTTDALERWAAGISPDLGVPPTSGVSPASVSPPKRASAEASIDLKPCSLRNASRASGSGSRTAKDARSSSTGTSSRSVTSSLEIRAESASSIRFWRRFGCLISWARESSVSRSPYSLINCAAVLTPMPETPGTLSDGSPASACTSMTFSGPTPNFSMTSSGPITFSFMASNITTPGRTNCIRSLSLETMVTSAPASTACLA